MTTERKCYHCDKPTTNELVCYACGPMADGERIAVMTEHSPDEVSVVATPFYGPGIGQLLEEHVRAGNPPLEPYAQLTRDYLDAGCVTAHYAIYGHEFIPVRGCQHDDCVARRRRRDRPANRQASE